MNTLLKLIFESFFNFKENASVDCLLTIIGNKTDLCKNDSTRVVKYIDGVSLAEVTFF